MRIDTSSAIRERTPFIGRANERSLLVKDLERGLGLLTITGPSGIGKTRLAGQVAADAAASYEGEGGVWVCSLAGCLRPADVESAVAGMLGITLQRGKDLGSALAHRGRLLLLLDNLDSVASQIGGVFRSWLERCPTLQLMTTSIVPIELEDAVRYELGPLEAGDAFSLYVERAHRASAGRITERDYPAVEELVRRLDRIPLAIELAAARVRVFPPQALLARFGDRFELLRSASQGRHGSLLEALTLTWELLPEREQIILARASVFDAGFSYDTAVAVLGEASSEGEMLDLLDGLRSKALLQLEGSAHPRFLLFESVREFATRELRRTGLEEDARRRYVSHFVERAEERAREVEGPGSAKAFAWLRSERENLIAILHHQREGDPGSAARVGIALLPLIKLEGHLPAGIHLLELTLQAARKTGDTRLISRAIACYYLAISRHGPVDEARAGLEEGLRLAREWDHREEECDLLVSLGWLHLRTGKLEHSARLLDQAIAIAREEGLPLLEVSALMIRGEGAHSRYAVDEAERFAAQAMEVLRAHDFPFREGTCLHWLALVWASQGRFQESRTAIRDALSRCRQAGNRGFEGVALMNLGGIELSAGRLDDSERYSLQALEIHREIGNRRGEAQVIGTLGMLALERGELDLAARRLQQSIAYFEENGDRKLRAVHLPFLAVAESRAGLPADTRRKLGEARAYFVEVDDRVSCTMTELLEGCLELCEARELVTKLAPPDPELDWPADAPSGERPDAASSLAGRLYHVLRTLAKTDEAEVAVLVENARSRLRAVAGEASGGLFEALRLLQQELARWDEEASGEEPDVEGLAIGPRAAWFALPGQGPVDLRRRLPIRRMLEVLVEKRLSSPGEGVEAQELFEAGWPDAQQLHPDHAMRRVYTGIWTLRDLGLADILLNQTDGYLLDPSVPLRARE